MTSVFSFANSPSPNLMTESLDRFCLDSTLVILFSFMFLNIKCKPPVQTSSSEFQTHIQPPIVQL